MTSDPDSWRAKSDRASLIRTFTGKLVNPLAMRPDDIDILDIAHHLANECRYAGACPEHYSVAQHSVLVSHHFDSPTLKLAGLLHDAEEAYLKDIPSPVKHDPRMAWYRDIADNTRTTIFLKYGLAPELEAVIKRADNALLWDETASFWGDKKPVSFVTPWAPRVAEAEFNHHFDWYWRMLHAA